jgi:tetratricopeptide (TPR) repeat protein
MNIARLELLFAFLNEDPHDPFNIYALALELSKTDAAKAMEYYQKLLNEHPSYIPAYYHAAKLYEALGMKSESEKVYIKGMSVSKQAGQMKAFRELKSAYDQLTGPDEEE